MELLEYELKTEDVETLQIRGVRWSILQCLHRFLCDTGYDVPYNPDLKIARSIIETRLRKKYVNIRTIMDVDDLLHEVQIKLSIKAILLTNFKYWEDLLKKAEKGKITRKEALEVPFMGTLIRKYEFLNLCVPLN